MKHPYRKAYCRVRITTPWFRVRPAINEWQMIVISIICIAEFLFLLTR